MQTVKIAGNKTTLLCDKRNFGERISFLIGDDLRRWLEMRVSVGGEKLFRVGDSDIKIDAKFVTDNLEDAIVAEFGIDTVDGQPTRIPWEAVIRMESDALAHFDSGIVHVFAGSLETAWRVYDRIVAEYRVPPDPEKPVFRIIKPQSDRYSTRKVEVRRSAEQSSLELKLHYGIDFLSWKETLIRLLSQANSGIHLFRGEPGTGKTSFIRHLICELKLSHRFFFLPSYEYYRVGNATLIDFFHDQQKDHPDQRLAVIMEDAEAVLMPRGIDNGFSVSALLNLSDGLLGDGLNLHIICTVNCEPAELDPAVVRPGRLRSAREFTLLSYEQARELAQHRGITLPAQRREYSIAEIYNLELIADKELKTKSIGFVE